MTPSASTPSDDSQPIWTGELPGNIKVYEYPDGNLVIDGISGPRQGEDVYLNLSLYEMYPLMAHLPDSISTLLDRTPIHGNEFHGSLYLRYEESESGDGEYIIEGEDGVGVTFSERQIDELLALLDAHSPRYGTE